VHAFANTVERKDTVPRFRTQNERENNSTVWLGTSDAHLLPQQPILQKQRSKAKSR